MKKLLKPLLIILAILILTITAFAVPDGSESNPWQVATYTDLQKVGCKDTTGDYAGWDLDSYYIQTADITCSGYWTPISQFWNDGFRGSYDGQGYKIDGLTVENEAYSSLFGVVTGGAEIKRVNLVNISITTNDSSTGGLAGYVRGNYIDVYECKVTGTITSNFEYSWGTYNYIGGLVGSIVSDFAIYFRNCYTDVDIVINYTDSQPRVGGFVGNASDATFTNCYSVGSITDTTGVGGFCGYKRDATATDCFWDTITSGISTSELGTGKTTTQMKDIDTYTDGGNWDMVAEASYVDEDWYIDDGNDYPHLGWEYEEGTTTNVLFIFSNF